MSDLLTHWAVFDDSRRLALIDRQLDPRFVQVLDKEKEFARLGALTRGGGHFVPALIRQARQRQSQKADNAQADRRLAFALGGITHYACDLMMKPLLRGYADDTWLETYEGVGLMRKPLREISAYYDTHVFRKVYLSGQEEPFSSFLLADNDTQPGKALEAFVYSLFQRALLSSHTLAPDWDNPETWLDNLFAKVQPLYVDIGMYVRIFANPDPKKMKLYRVESDFYLEDDPIVKVARARQQCQNVPEADYEYALQNGANKGGYGRALALSMRTLRATTLFWQGSGEMPDVSQG
jgi:hypothetical protein